MYPTNRNINYRSIVDDSLFSKAMPTMTQRRHVNRPKDDHVRVPAQPSLNLLLTLPLA
ncbi:hypothetical protein IF2G_00462 [Cordyceps javanica]|nr:hypothetical protein IF2G_00462 [Cordyceps javanica]